MPNLDLDNKDVAISDQRVKDILGKDKISGNDLTTTISRYENNESKSDDDSYVLNYLNGLLNRERNSIDARKRVRMNIGAQGTKSSVTGDMNNFKKGTTKDGIGDLKPTGDAKLTSKGLDGKTNHNDKVSDSNRITYYESYGEEIEAMRYLIEYMDNNKTKI
jgi:hypothetical protein